MERDAGVAKGSASVFCGLSLFWFALSQLPGHVLFRLLRMETGMGCRREQNMHPCHEICLARVTALKILCCSCQTPY